MFSGVSGLKGHQTRMDVIGNNIANVNTTGFKASRVTFADMISQNLSGASSPTGNIGGVNPKQVGLGMSVASTDLIYTNGSVQQTGKNTDVAISRGDGLFVVSKGEQKYYTRNGAFIFDAEGNLTLPNSGLYVQGYMADNGVLNVAGDNTTKIRIPAGKSMEAKTTATASYTKNLNASTPGYEVANTLVKYADGTSETVANYTVTETGRISLTLSTGETVTLDGTAGYPFDTATPVAGKTLYTSKISNVTASPTGKVDLKLGIDLTNASSPKEIAGGTADISLTGLESGTYAFGGTYNISGTITKVTTVGTNEIKLELAADNNFTNPKAVTTVTVPSPTTFTYKVGDTYNGQLKIKEVKGDVGSTLTTADGNKATLATAVTVTSATQTFARVATAADGNVASTSRVSIYEYNNKTVSGVVLNTKSGTSIDGLVAKNYSQGDTFYPSVATAATGREFLGGRGARGGGFFMGWKLPRTTFPTTSECSTKPHTLLHQQKLHSRMRNPAYDSPPLRARFGGWQRIQYIIMGRELPRPYPLK